MNHQALARSLQAALALGLATAAPGAWAAIDFVVTVPASNPVTPALANAVSQGHSSSIYLTVANIRAGTNVTQINFTVPGIYLTEPNGGLGPPGWVVTQVENGIVHFKIADCAQSGTYGIQAGSAHASQTFRIDVQAPSGSMSTDMTDAFGGVAPSDPCGGTTGWTTTPGGNIPIPRKALYVTASPTYPPVSGASPFSTSVVFTVTNESTATLNPVSLGAVTVTASAGATYTPGGCTPAGFSMLKGTSKAVTCSYLLTAASGVGSSFTFSASASGPSATAVGAIAGPILAGPATASFAFDSLGAAAGETVRASLSVANHTAGPITATPPTYGQLTLTNLQQAAGAPNPSPASIGAGGTALFHYSLVVPGSTPVSSSYVATGTASTTAGPTNEATTPAGTVGSFLIRWIPAAFVRARLAKVNLLYPFTLTVLNGSPSSIVEIDIVNPQNGSWTDLADAGTTGSIVYTGKSKSGSVSTIIYKGSVASGATATLHFGFSDVPPDAGDSITATKTYPFQAVVKLLNGTNLTVTRDLSVVDTLPIDDLSNVSVLSRSAGQTVYWTNKDAPVKNEYHDGVVVFVTAAGTVPPNPADLKDCRVDALPAGVIRSYADVAGSLVASWADAVPGAFNYRVCNHDENFIYSDCNSGFWNGLGYLDSVALPSGVSWAHALGGAIYGYPGAYQLAPGTTRLGVATNVPALAVLDAVTGQRPFDPAALSALPNVGTPAAPLGNGAALAFGADNAGKITAVDLQGGTSGWSATKTGERFVGGIAGVLKQYVGAAYQASYSTDVLFMGSSAASGNLLAIDARIGATLWTKAPATAGAFITTQPHYDYPTNRLYVAYDNGGGIVAYENLASAAAPGTPKWSKAGASYLTPCTFGAQANQIACIDGTGVLHAFAMDTGAEGLNAPGGYPTAVATAGSLWPVTGGYVVSNATVVKRLTVSGGAVTLERSWTPGGGVTLAPLLVGGSYIYVAASDKKIHKLNLADATDTGVSVTLNPSQAGAVLSAPAVDPWDNLFLLGSSDGRLWAVPLF